MNRTPPSYYDIYTPPPQPPRLLPRVIRILLLGIALLLGLALIPPLVFGQPSPLGCLLKDRQDFKAGNVSWIRDLQMLSADEGWAIGGIGYDDYFFHYSKGRWTAEKASNNPNTLYMVSATEGWAGGHADTFFRYNGWCWQSVGTSWFAGLTREKVESLVMVSATDGWASQTYGGIYRYNGRAWSKVKPFVDMSSGGIFATEPNNIWFVGGNVDNYNNGSWQRVADRLDDPRYQGYKLRSITRGPGVGGVSSVPYAEQGLPNNKVSGDYVTSIYMTSADKGWAVGGNSRKNDARMWHYKDGKWLPVESPAGSWLRSIYMTSPDEGWVVGQGVILHYTNGRWVDYFAEGK